MQNFINSVRHKENKNWSFPNPKLGINPKPVRLY